MRLKVVRRLRIEKRNLMRMKRRGAMTCCLMLSGHRPSDDYSERHFHQQPEALSGRKEVAGCLVEHGARKVHLFHYLRT